MMSSYLAQLDAMGATIALTADHGMNAKTDAAGAPQIIFLQDWYDAQIGAGAARVILPVTDPYVAHHGSLGSFATAYLPVGANQAELAAKLRKVAGVELVLSRAEAAAKFELPPDRIGDVVIVSERLFVIGTSPSRHDLSGLDAPLRSHGGVSEQLVPLLFNRPLKDVDADPAPAQLRHLRPRAQPCPLIQARRRGRSHDALAVPESGRDPLRRRRARVPAEAAARQEGQHRDVPGSRRHWPAAAAARAGGRRARRRGRPDPAQPRRRRPGRRSTARSGASRPRAR